MRASPVSTSVQLSVIALAVSSVVVALPFVQVGVSLTAVTVRSKVATLLSAVPSFTLKVKLSEPL